MLKKVFGKIFGTQNDKEIKKYKKRVELINALEDKLSKELHRYNSLLAKNTLYTIAGRQHLIYFNAVTRNQDEAKQHAERAWNVAVERLKKSTTKEGEKDD